MAQIIVATILRPTGTTGVQTHFGTFVEWLKVKEISVSVITPFNAPLWLVYPVFAVRSVLDVVNGLVSVWWYRYWHTVFLQIALRRYLKNAGDCIVYAQCPLSAAAALRSRRHRRQRVVLVVHFNISQADEWAEKGKIHMEGAYAKSIREFEADTLAQIDGLVFVSDFMRLALTNRIPQIRSIPFAVVPNFVRDHGFPGGAPKLDGDLLMVGTLEPRKNQAYALEIIAAAAKQGHTFTLTVAGDGPDRAALTDFSRSLGISDQIHFLGFVRNAAELFLYHRACLHVARMESFGIVLIEAMSRGLPVFSPAVGGMKEVYTDYLEGRYIPLDDANKAAAILIECFNPSSSFLMTAGLSSRQTFLKKFQSEVAAEQLLKFLASLDA